MGIFTHPSLATYPIPTLMRSDESSNRSGDCMMIISSSQYLASWAFCSVSWPRRGSACSTMRSMRTRLCLPTFRSIVWPAASWDCSAAERRPSRSCTRGHRVGTIKAGHRMELALPKRMMGGISIRSQQQHPPMRSLETTHMRESLFFEGAGLMQMSTLHGAVVLQSRLRRHPFHLSRPR